jgi:hypothetical protein
VPEPELPPPLRALYEKRAAEIAAAGVPTESQMREAEVPTPATPEELAAYVRALVDRPHDYGTCCHAMSMAAVAALRYVAGALGVTGFQASCADMDILRRTRRLEWGRIQNFDDLLYPQYRSKFTGWPHLLEEHKVELAGRARELLARHDGVHAADAVRAHWQRLAAAGPPEPGEETGGRT